MNTRRWFLSLLTVATAAIFLLFAFLAPTVQASTNDREYLLGDHTAPPNPDENASNGAAVGSGNGFGTLDSEGLNGMDQLPPLVPKGTTLPVYRTIVGRPDGGGGLGIEFDGSQSQYVHGQSLNWPEESLSAIGGDFSGTINYNGIVDRGMQFWVQPAATTVQSIVMDSNQHGVRINDSGNFSMRYADRDTDSGIEAMAGTWYHVMVVRPQGVVGGSRMFIDGVAVAADNESDYSSDDSNLVIGANTAGGDGFLDGFPGGEDFTGGTEEFFTGIVDDLNMFVIGNNSFNEGPPVGQDYGPFDFATDNGFAAFTLSGVAGDVDNNGDFEEADKTAFIAGWMYENLVDGIRVGDLASLGNGDLNFDGITDINDLVIIQAELPVAGLSAITGAELAGVPEPAAISLLLAAAILAPATCRRFS